MGVQRMQNFAQKTIETSFYGLFLITPFLFTPWNSELFEFNKMYFVYAVTSIVAGFWAIKSVSEGKFIFKRTFLDIPIILFLSSQVLSTILSIDRHTSIWGYYSRSHGGLLSTISYLVLYWAYVSNLGKKQTQNIVNCLLFSASIISIYAILEHFGESISCLVIKGQLNTDCWVQDVKNRVFATLGQPNWLAAWLAAILPLGWMRIICKEQETKTSTLDKILFSHVPVILLFSALLYTKSRSGILGFMSAYFIFWVLHLLTTNFSNLKKHFLLITCSLSLITFFIGTPWSPSAGQIINSRNTQPATNDRSTTVLERGGTESGEIRKIVWRGAIDIWHAYPIFGSGIETFAYSYYNFRPVEHNKTSEWDFLYNKAHNEYLNFAATTGTFGLGSYLLLVLSFYLVVLKKMWEAGNGKLDISHFLGPASHVTLPISILAGYAGILVTNFFGFSTVSAAILFFLFPALIVNSEKKTENRELKPINLRTSPLIILFLLLTFYFLLRIAQLWYADILYAEADKYNKQGLYASSIKNMSEAINLRPNEPIYYDKLAQGASYLAMDLSESGDASASSEAASLALDSSGLALSISPRSLNLLKSRATTLIRLSAIDPSYLKKAVFYLEQAARLAPTDPKIHYNLGALYNNLGQNQKAQETLEQTIILKPDYYDARFGLAKVYKDQGKKQEALEKFQYILDHLNPNDEAVQKEIVKLKQ